LVHISSSNGEEVSIGDNSFVGANSKLDQCTLEPFSYVGYNAKIGAGVVIESYSIVASGAVVPDGTVIKSGQVWAGHPAHYLRDVSQQEKHLINEHMLDMQQLSQIYCEETEKTT
jgi:carbonic anhydrase/acetyltransferase-like protein (isoleucine patch superfamily)